MQPGANQLKPLWQRIAETPTAFDTRIADDRLAELDEKARGQADLTDLATLLDQPAVWDLLSGVFVCSTYLSGLILREPARLARILAAVPEAHLRRLEAQLYDDMAAAGTQADAMRILRQYKAEVALLIALTDTGGVWPVMTVTAALSDAADAATGAAVRYLFRAAIAKGDWLGDGGPDPQTDSGYIVIGMGKHGARELNYSSDIDLIVFFEPDLVRLRVGIEPLAFFVRLTRDLVRLMQERTEHGYVFRTDLRLRPDPGATQIAISTPAALNYYESFGQNWERAAMIKARAVAGDIPAGTAFIAELAPFVWRKYLDFAAIADIHAMKRQIHAFKGFGEIGVAGHNIKVGRGGIREIEFFAQTQQLIAGGRQPDLRQSDTLGALDRLVERGWLRAKVRDELSESYQFLRRIEHRLQMIADEQTQTLPADPDGLLRLALFAGYSDTAAFSSALVSHLERVQGHYGALFEDVPELTSGKANMVFAGEQDDPGTVEALARMGYKNPSTIIEAVRGWHHGRYAAIRTPRARELLTEVQPLLIEALARTNEPDAAFYSFDRFLAQLPSGVQLFSLLRANPSLLRLVADIMGSAPRLARIMSRRRRVLDAVLDPGFFGSIPDEDALARIIDAEIDATADYQEALDRARVVGTEQAFLIGVRVLSGTITAAQAGGAYAALAERLVDALKSQVERELIAQSGNVDGGAACVVAMGKLGGREMTAASDLDLILVYDFDPAVSQSDGPRPLAPSQYYSRLTQRLISALSAPTAEGLLYEVDMRLRPSGQKGPVATQLSSFEHYQEHDAWTWEHMALTRARVISGPEDLRQRVTDAVRRTLVRPRDRAKLAADVREMRERIAKEKGTDDIWELKQVRGGLVDIEFIAQFLQLAHAQEHPEILDQNTIGALKKLAAAGFLAPHHADTLIPAAILVHDLTEVLRLCLDGPFEPGKAPDGLRVMLTRAGDAPDFARLEAALAATLADVAALFNEIIV